MGPLRMIHIFSCLISVAVCRPQQQYGGYEQNGYINAQQGGQGGYGDNQQGAYLNAQGGLGGYGDAQQGGQGGYGNAQQGGQGGYAEGQQAGADGQGGYLDAQQGQGAQGAPEGYANGQQVGEQQAYMEVTEVSYVDEPAQPRVVIIRRHHNGGLSRGSARNIFGLPSVGNGLADIGQTAAKWGAGVLRAAGTLL